MPKLLYTPVGCVYKIFDIQTNEIIYIGSTKNFYTRLMAHINASNKGRNNHAGQLYLYTYIRNNQCKIEVIEECDNYVERERELIKLYRPKYNYMVFQSDKEWRENNKQWHKNWQIMRKELNDKAIKLGICKTKSQCWDIKLTVLRKLVSEVENGK